MIAHQHDRSISAGGSDFFSGLLAGVGIGDAWGANHPSRRYEQSENKDDKKSANHTEV